MKLHPAQRVWRPGVALAMALTLLALPSGHANPVNLSYLDGKDPVAPDAITAYGPDLFGDRVNLFNGALEFEHTDLSLPGNSKLPVALVRHHNPGQSYFIRGQFGDWDLQTPRITGTFSSYAGWTTTTSGTNRCSGFSLPPTVAAWSDPFGQSAQPRGGSSISVPGKPAPLNSGSTVGHKAAGVQVGFIAADYWRRTSLDVPGQGSQEVLVRSSGYPIAPSDGGAYPLVTHANWQIGCLPTLQNAPGEGFVAVSPEGVRYRFDWMGTRAQTGVKKNGAEIGRIDMALMATQVTDRFGNWVRYTYDSANPWLLTRIEASDGRLITVTNSGGRATSATDSTRTYNYSYGPQGELSAVQLPDGTRWTFDLVPFQPLDLRVLGEGANCDFPGDFPADPLTGTITHPSGAVGTFTLNHLLFGRTWVDRKCYYKVNSQTQTTGPVWPKTVVGQALVSKQIAGPGMSTMRWTYAYDAPGAWSNCAQTSSCKRETRLVTVTDPMGVQVRHTFGSRWRVNEGQLLQLDEGWNGTSAVKTTTYRYRTSDGQAFPEMFGASLLPNSDWLSWRHRPQDQRIVALQSNTFTWQADESALGFDGFAQPALVRKFSSLGHNRTEKTLYAHNFNKWVLGQVAQVTETTTGREIESHDYDSATALKTASRSFGKKMNSYGYNADGTIDTVKDAADRAIRLTKYKRGKPQSVAYPDGNSESQVINNLGNADSRTNAAGTTTSFLYDTMGRVAKITYPTGDAASYHSTTQVFEPVGTAEYGLPAGHWRQTISTGNALKLRYFDAMWRKRLELRYDTANSGSTSSFEETRYDANGRKAFESYAERGFTKVDEVRAGRATYYDAIDRVVALRADSEIGVLQTTTQYPANAYQRVVTNPRGYNTTFDFQAFDVPNEDSITQVTAPEGVVVAIVRDMYGKPMSITRAGPSASATRSYVYDIYQRLCKTVEPESGATIQDYDPAGNVAWRASGQSLLGLGGCDWGSVPANSKVSFGYDARDRLISTSYGDGSAGVTRTYTADGLPSTINTNDLAWTLGYNNRRMMVTESLLTSIGSYGFGYGIDSHGHVSSMTYPGGSAIGYSPDALGRPTEVSGYASAITYHPNGALASYTATNGVAFDVTQNTRRLPKTWRHAGVVQDGYAYDADGNVVGIADLQENVSSRTMSYDGLDRLTGAAGIWGTARYEYDGLDNLVSSQVGGRSLAHTIDRTTNRLVSLSGSLNLGIGYDANGNITQRGSQGFSFDIGNRLQSATGVGYYTYDGLGRRGWAMMTNGRQVLRVYGQSGRLLLTQDSQKGVTHHIHLGDKVLAEKNTISGTRWMHTDALGSPVVSTGTGGAVLEKTRYEPYGARAAGVNPDGIGFTGHVNDLATGLVYMQQRYYDPVAGRFLSVDPVTTDAATGGHFNRYVYAANKPYKLVDPDGRGPCDPGSGYTCRVYDYQAVADSYLAQRLASELNSAGRGAKNLAKALIAAAANLVKSESEDSEVKPSLLDPKGEQHILDGDMTGGGHRPGTGKPGKSEFPKGWSDERIKGEISDVATDPASVRSPGRNGREIVRGTRGGIDIEVIMEPDGRIVTGYPTNVPRNPN